MQKRSVAKPAEKETNDNYFKGAVNLEFIRSGCVVFDCMLGGGWPLGRMSNLVGDKSTGKTLCAIEAAANFARQYPDGLIFYREAEAAFDESYASALGLPTDRIDFGPEGLDTIWDTVEDIFTDLDAACKECTKENKPGLYIIDSLDALSSKAEVGRSIEEGSYGMEKQKILGQLFRRQVRKIKEARMHLLIISQVREKIGISFGDKYRRSGGKALDFYATQIVYLSHLGQIPKTRGGIKRIVANKVRAKCQKNKIGMPFRECEFIVEFGYGIDEVGAAVKFLEDAKATKLLEGYDKEYVSRMAKMDKPEYKRELITLRKAVKKAWRTIEEDFTPTRRKYV